MIHYIFTYIVPITLCMFVCFKHFVIMHSWMHVYPSILQYIYGECVTCCRTNCHQAHSLKMFNLYVSFLSHSSIKIVSQKKVILLTLSQNLPVGFSNGQFYDGRQRPSFCNAHTLAHSLSPSLSLFACFPFFPFAYKNNASVHFRLLMF